MENALINCFADSGISVLESFGLEVKAGDPKLRTSPYDANSLVVVIGMTGALHGQVLISLNYKTVLTIAGIMMGMEPEEMDEIAKSAIAELSNMIIGNAVTLLSKNNFFVYITPPSVLAGDNIRVSTSLTNISMPLKISGLDAEIELSISAKEFENLAQ